VFVIAYALSPVQRVWLGRRVPSFLGVLSVCGRGGYCDDYDPGVALIWSVGFLLRLSHALRACCTLGVLISLPFLMRESAGGSFVLVLTLVSVAAASSAFRRPQFDPGRGKLSIDGWCLERLGRAPRAYVGGRRNPASEYQQKASPSKNRAIWPRGGSASARRGRRAPEPVDLPAAACVVGGVAEHVSLQLPSFASPHLTLPLASPLFILWSATKHQHCVHQHAGGLLWSMELAHGRMVKI